MNSLFISIIILIFLAIIFRPVIGVYLMAACLPIIGRDINLGEFTLPISDLVALLTLIGFVVNLFWRALFKPKERLKTTWPLFFPFLMFFLASILSIIFSHDKTGCFYYFLRWPFFLYVAYIFIPANIITDAKTLKKTVVIVFLSAMAVLVSGYLSLIGQDWQNSFFRLKSVYFWGGYPFGENHNLIAEFLNIGVFFVLVIKEFLKRKKERRLADIIFFLTALGIILTFSRAGWITLFLQLGIYLFYRTKNDSRKKLSIAIFALLGAVIISPLLWKMSVLQDSNTSSTENRILLTEIAWQAFKEKPLFGYGSGEFIGLVGNNIRFVAKYGAPIDSHGVLQKVMAENGALGLISWLFILAYLVRFSILAIKKYYPKVPWVLPFALAALGGIFFQFFNTSYFKGRVWFPLSLFWLAIKFSEQVYAEKNKNSSHPA